MLPLFSASGENHRFCYAILLFLSSIYLTIFTFAAHAQTNIPPTAEINVDDKVRVGSELLFNSDNSTDTDGNITQYLWSFGDNTTSSEPNPVHIYQAAGTYDVALTVTDNTGANDQKTTQVRVILVGDFDEDGDIDRDDVAAIAAARHTSAEDYPEFDIDHNGIINSSDARRLVLMCTNPRCMPDPPLLAFYISYPGSEVGDKTTTLDEFLVKTRTGSLYFRTVAYSLDGINWNIAKYAGGVFQYNFGVLEAGEYTLQLKLDDSHPYNFIITVEAAQINIPGPVTDFILPMAALVEVDFSIGWQDVDGATSYKLYINGEETEQTGATEVTLNLPVIGVYNVQISACNASGCSELNSSQSLTIYHTEINFNDYVIGSYAGEQDGVGSTSLFEGGRGLSLQGNVWKQIPYNYTVSVNTILAFDFISTEQGSLHGIGLSPDLDENLVNTFQVYGSENCCINEFNNYPGGGVKQHYEIMIGQYYRGEFNHLFFIMDDDTGSGGANGTFTAVHFFEEVRVPPAATGLSLPSVVGLNQNVLVSWDSVPEALHYRVNINGQLYQSVESTSLSLSFAELGDYMVGIQACNELGCNVEAERQLIQVLPAPKQVKEIKAVGDNVIEAKTFTLIWENLNDASVYKLYIDDVLQELDIARADLNIASAGSHQIQIQACSQFGCGLMSQVFAVNVMGPPASVQNLALPALNAASQAIPISWDVLTNADYYDVAVDDTVVTSVSTSASELSFSNSGSYLVSVRACNLAGCGDFSSGLNAQVQALPSVVLGINVSNNGRVGKSIPISWLPVENASYYSLLLDDVLLPSVLTVQNQLDVTFEGQHTLQIAACSQIGCGPNAPVTFQVAANPGPAAKDLSLSITQQNQVIQQDLATLVNDENGLDWSSLTLVKPALGQVNAQGSMLSIDYNLVHFVGQERIEYTVNDTLGAPSNKGMITLNVNVIQTPGIPAQLTIAELTPSEQLTFGWSAATETDIRYLVERQLNTNPWQVVQEASVEHQATVKQPLNGTHRFRVKACRVGHNLCSEFAQSNDLLIANAPRPIPNILPPTDDGEGEIRLQWLASSNATYYKVEQQRDLQGWQLVQQDVNSTLLLVTVEGNGQFQFRITACNTVGCSASVTSTVAELAYLPQSPSVVTLTPTGGNETLNWSQVELADWYLIETESGGQWQGVNGNSAQRQYMQNTLVLSPKPTGDVRVQACNNYGCSAPPTLAVAAKVSETPINVFYADKNVLSRAGYETSLHWDVKDAADVSIVSDLGQNYTNLPSTGSMTVAPELSTQFTLNAKAHSLATLYSQVVEIVVAEEGDDIVANLPSDPSISPIVSSILIEATGDRIFGDLQGSIVSVDADGNIIWQKQNTGMIYSPPVKTNNKYYFTSTADNGQGSFCGINSNGSNLHCVSFPHAIIGAPIIDGNRALLVDLYGGVSSINLTNDAITSLGDLPAGKQVRSTSILTPQNTLVVRSTVNDIYMLDLNAPAGTIGWTQTIAGEQE